MSIDRFIKRKLLLRGDYSRFVGPYLSKARRNLALARFLYDVSDGKSLHFPFKVFDWVIIISYYAIYMSALAAISKMGYKSDNHTATIAVLEKLIDQKNLNNIRKAVIIIIEHKGSRESAQYDSGPDISRVNASSALNDADEFITYMESFIKHPE